MKKILIMLVALGFAGAVYANPELEPCLNGDVSASGKYVSQQTEDRIMAEMAEEPCLVGDQS